MSNLKPNPNLKANLKLNPNLKANLKPNLKEKKFRGSIFFSEKKIQIKKKHTHNTNKLNALYLFMLSMN